MKNRVWFLYAIPFILITSIVVGCFWLCEEFFPKAPEIDCPAQTEILSATVSAVSADMDVVVDVSADDWAGLLILLGNCTPTRMQSINDTPTVRYYYEFALKTEGRVYSYFLYEDDGQVYLEMPYTGIYRAQKDFLWFAQMYIWP